MPKAQASQPAPVSKRFIIIIIMKTTRALLTLIGLMFLLLQPAGAVSSARAQGETSLALVLTFDGPITPALTQYLERGLRAAEQQKAEVLILQL
jgi:membrane-bound serine protease (ClpP class)